MHYSTKTYGHERGFSCAFRQWRANSHCKLIHGYALSIHIEFAAKQLDERNWVIDFGGLKELERELELMFDHTLVVAKDDPQLPEIARLEDVGLADIRVVDRVGCEAFCELVYLLAQVQLKKMGELDRVQVSKVEIKEHGANGAIFKP